MPLDSERITDFNALKQRFDEILSNRQEQTIALADSALDSEAPAYDKQILERFNKIKERFERIDGIGLDAKSVLVYQMLNGAMYLMADAVLRVIAESNRLLLEKVQGKA